MQVLEERFGKQCLHINQNGLNCLVHTSSVDLLCFLPPLFLFQRGRTALFVAQQGSYGDITALIQAHHTHAGTSL